MSLRSCIRQQPGLQTTDYSMIANLAVCYGEERLRHFDELYKDAPVHALEMQSEDPEIITTLRRSISTHVDVD